jgi:hypothetical protein
MIILFANSKLLWERIFKEPIIFSAIYVKIILILFETIIMLLKITCFVVFLSLKKRNDLIFFP